MQLRPLPHETIEEFHSWLVQHGADSETTARQWSYCVGAVYKRNSLRLADYPPTTRKGYRLAWRAWQTWRREYNEQIPDLIYAQGTTHRVKQAVSIPEEAWYGLVAQLKTSDQREELVVLLTALTGWRIGEVLRLDADALQGIEEHAPKPRVYVTVKGGDRIAYPIRAAQLATFLRLRDGVRATRCPNVAAWVSEGDPNSSARGAAYQRVRRAIRAQAKAVGIADRVYLHRLRRTAAVMILRRTKDTTHVTGTLLHRDPKSALKYVDEVRLDETVTTLDTFLPE